MGWFHNADCSIAQFSGIDVFPADPIIELRIDIDWQSFGYSAHAKKTVPYADVQKMKAPGHRPRLSLQPPTKPNEVQIMRRFRDSQFSFSLLGNILMDCGFHATL